MGNIDSQFFISGILPVVVLVGVFYFFLIRPQNKKDKETNKMRNNLQPGDEVSTIGGIVGKVVKTKPDSVILQCGADRVKIEVMRWGISKVIAPASSGRAQVGADEGMVNPKKLPKKLKSTDAADEE